MIASVLWLEHAIRVPEFPPGPPPAAGGGNADVVRPGTDAVCAHGVRSGSAGDCRSRLCPAIFADSMA